MSWITRIANAVRADHLNRELDEEFEAHIADAISEGRDPIEARRAFGPPLRQREAIRQFQVSGWLDGLRADIVFGWRQLKRNKVTSAAAVLSRTRHGRMRLRLSTHRRPATAPPAYR